MNAIEYPPYQRLHISNHAYKPAHVFNIACDLSKRWQIELPGYDSNDQTRWAYWITNKFGYDNQLIVDAHHRVQRSYNGREGIYRKGRKVGSKNRFSSRPEDYPERPGTDPLDDVLGGMSEATPPTEPLTTDKPTPPSLDLSTYALKTDLYRVSEAITAGLKPTYEQLSREVQLLRSDADALKTKVGSIVENRPTIVTLERRELSSIELGVQHKHFPRLLKMCNARNRQGERLNVWLVGPAGTGKTTAAKHVAAALTPGRFFALPAMESGFQILGYKDSNGVYQSTLFRECWEHGGTIIMDESDSYSPSAALAANGALANGVAAFPDGMIARHPDCIIIAGANTTGLGGTWEYSGRMKLDAAFMNRWVTLEWPIDNGLEDAMCANKPWLAIVRHVRAQVIAKQIKGAMITPRASVYGETLLAGGLTIEETMESTLKNGMSTDQWRQIAPASFMIEACI